ncbi:MAG: sugar phosphate isomerase/epimerase family protein [Brachybacterium sp.]
MQIGVHGLVFAGEFDEGGLVASASGAQQAGFDLLELPLADPFGADGALIGRIVREHDLALTASLGLTADTDVSSEDPATVRRGTDLLRRAVDVVAEAGGEHLCGVIHSAMQKYLRPATEAGRENSARALAEVAEHARGAGIPISLEIVNRYESNLVNTARGALAHLEQIDHPNAHLHLDTYHMNIEESDMASPVLESGDALRYVHIGESHRGYLGTGSVDFGTFYRALDRIGYDGPIVFESFSSAVVSEALSNTLGVWRNLWDDSADLAAHANRTIRDSLRAVETISLH